MNNNPELKAFYERQGLMGHAQAAEFLGVPLQMIRDLITQGLLDTQPIPWVKEGSDHVENYRPVRTAQIRELKHIMDQQLFNAIRDRKPVS